VKLSALERKIGRGDVIKWRRRIVLSSNRAGVYVRALPKFKKGWQSPNQRAWVEAFSTTARASKTPAPTEMSAATDLAKGTLWYYRDVLQTAMYGKLFRFNHEEPVKTPTVEVYRTTTEAMTTGIEKILTPQAALWDNNVFWSATSNPTRLTVKSAGLYLIGAQVEIRPETDGSRLVRLRYDGSTYGAAVTAKTGTDFPAWMSVLEPHYFHPNEYVELAALVIGTGQTTKINTFWALAITPEALIP